MSIWKHGSSKVDMVLDKELRVLHPYRQAGRERDSRLCLRPSSNLSSNKDHTHSNKATLSIIPLPMTLWGHFHSNYHSHFYMSEFIPLPPLKKDLGVFHCIYYTRETESLSAIKTFKEANRRSRKNY